MQVAKDRKLNYANMIHATAPPYKQPTPNVDAAATMPTNPLPWVEPRTYNIQNGCRFSLLQAIRAVYLVNHYVMLLIETKILDEVYWKNCIRYDALRLKKKPTAAG